VCTHEQTNFKIIAVHTYIQFEWIFGVLSGGRAPSSEFGPNPEFCLTCNPLKFVGSRSHRTKSYFTLSKLVNCVINVIENIMSLSRQLNKK